MTGELIRLSPFPLTPPVLATLERAYADPPRAYHSLTHVVEVARWFDRVRTAGPGWQHPNDVFAAVLFHDAIYDARRHDNEARSAELARATLAATPGLELDRVAHLINLTARHGRLTAAELSADEALFLDCDMAILGAKPDAFAAYDRAIAVEYAHLPPQAFSEGRRRFLHTLLDSPRIFLSPFFHQQLDPQSRDNLRAQLARGNRLE